MRQFFHQVYQSWGLPAPGELLFAWTAALASMVVLSYLLGWLIRGVIGSSIHHMTKKTQNRWDDYLFDKVFFRRLGIVVPAMVSYFLFTLLLFPTATASSDELSGSVIVYNLVRKVILLWICLGATAFIDRFINNVETGFLAILGERRVPIRSYVQVAKILLFLVAGILVVSIVLDQNPLAILAGLGALTAVLLLVFKDSLLGFVASLQVNTNNLVQIGDWIEFPSQNIDGEVVDIALSVVKIRSGDNTVYSLPTYNLVSQPFKNWRNVKEIGARRVKLSFSVDLLTLAPVSEAQRQKLAAQGLWKVPADLPDATNAEAFRYWTQNHLETHAEVHPEQPRVVKLGDPTGRGLPFEMVFYTRLTGYPDWEHLRSRLLCQALAALPAFGLRAFQEPVGVMGA